MITPIRKIDMYRGERERERERESEREGERERERETQRGRERGRETNIQRERKSTLQVSQYIKEVDQCN